MKFLTALVALFSFIALTPGGAIAAEETEEQIKARKKAEAEASQKHELSVFGYLNPVRGRIHSRRRPILITLNVKGTEALSHFCLQKPLIGETVLKVIGWGPAPNFKDKKVFESKQQSFHRAFAQVLPEKSLTGVSLKLGNSVSDFGKQLHGTKKACGGK
jgi:hypothetical protein